MMADDFFFPGGAEPEPGRPLTRADVLDLADEMDAAYRGPGVAPGAELLRILAGTGENEDHLPDS